MHIPGVICECDNCHSVVMIKSDENIIFDVLIDILFFIILLVSMNLFGSILWGVFLFTLWAVARIITKSNGKLEYI